MPSWSDIFNLRKGIRMRYGLLFALVGSVLLVLVTALTAQASMKGFCAKRWHGMESMQQYCLDVQEQSTERLAQLLDILDAAHEQMRASGSNPDTDVAARCSRQHHLKVFDAYHNQLVESCLVRYLDHLQQARQPRRQYTVSVDDF